jgi:hypothetical protein
VEKEKNKGMATLLADKSAGLDRNRVLWFLTGRRDASHRARGGDLGEQSSEVIATTGSKSVQYAGGLHYMLQGDRR